MPPVKSDIISHVWVLVLLCDNSNNKYYCNFSGATDIVVEFDPVMYGPFTEGAQQSVIFRLVAQTTPTEAITVLFSTVSQTAIGTIALILCMLIYSLEH